MTEKPKPSSLLIVLFAITMFIPSTLWYLGALAPITNDQSCSIWTKIQFGVMLRCNCISGQVVEWEVINNQLAYVSINKGLDSVETWTIQLDGRYFY